MNYLKSSGLCDVFKIILILLKILFQDEELDVKKPSNNSEQLHVISPNYDLDDSSGLDLDCENIPGDLFSQSKPLPPSQHQSESSKHKTITPRGSTNSGSINNLVPGPAIGSRITGGPVQSLVPGPGMGSHVYHHHHCKCKDAKQHEDPLDVFGKYIAAELRSLGNPHIIRQTKLGFMKLLEAAQSKVERQSGKYARNAGESSGSEEEEEED